MVAIKFNGVRKMPGRPTLVEGVEGRRYVNDKILRALEATQKNAGGFKAYSTYSPFEDYSNWQEYLDETGSLTDNTANETAETFQWYPTADGETDDQTENVQEGNVPVADEGRACDQEVQGVPDYQVQSVSDETVRAAYRADDQVHFAPEETSRTAIEEGFEIGPNLKAVIEETNSHACITEHQIRYQAVADSTYEADLEEYFDYPENGMFSLHPNSSDWLANFEQDETRWKRNRTAILRLPTSGVVRSCRGTVELLVHADGRTFKPIYNKCGMLTAVHCSDGYMLVKNRCSGAWSLFGPNGIAVNDDVITYVAFDKQGNLSYQSQSGRLVTLYVDGKTVASA